MTSAQARAAILSFAVLLNSGHAQQSEAPSAEAVIGWRLFFDESLSRNENVSCASCHDPELAFTDGRQFGEGTHGDELTRNTPTIVNLASAEQFFWDGRAPTLEKQVEGPLTHPQEMDMTLDEVVARVRADQQYQVAFRNAGIGQIDIGAITAAIASFERTLVTGPIPYENWLSGNMDALDDEQSNGRFLFFTRGQCATCHIGPNFTDNRLHNIGTGTATDSGRYGVTGLADDRGLFKTPSLRNWRGTEPFMHDGRFDTMADVIAFYADPPVPEIGESELDALRFGNEEQADLLAFLETLNGAWPDLSNFSVAWQLLSSDAN